MRHASYLPDADAPLGAFADNLAAKLPGYAPDLGLSPEEIAALQAAAAAFDRARFERLRAVNAARAATRSLEEARAALAGSIRGLVEQVQISPGCTDPMRGELGLAVPRKRRAFAPELTAAPTIVLGRVRQLTAEMRLVRLGGGPGSGKPAEADGVEVVAAVGRREIAQTLRPASARTVYFGGRPRCVVRHEAAEAGKPVRYWARYYNTRGPGPWSSPVDTMVQSDALSGAGPAEATKQAA
ncbi:MAG: hypothetical protein ACFCVE_13805 [Phycisphaerae bacterium]